MVRVRRGSSQLGCLLTILAGAVVLYFGVNIGSVFWDYFQFVDRMKQEVRVAASRSDAEIKQHMAAYADVLGLPESARRVYVKRGDRIIVIWSEYYHNLEFPGYVKEVRFSPQAMGAF